MRQHRNRQIAGKSVGDRIADFVDRHMCGVFITPAFLVTILLLAYPICISVYYSFTNKSLLGKAVKFVGFNNYVSVLQNPDFYHALWNTLVYTIISLSLQFTQQLNTAISELTNEEMAADIISLIRRYAIGSTLISHEARIRRAVDKLKKAHKFTAIEQKWIGRMEKYLMEESVLNVGVFDEDTRFRSEGGFKKIDRIFQNKLESIVLELNEYLYDDGGRSA